VGLDDSTVVAEMRRYEICNCVVGGESFYLNQRRGGMRSITVMLVVKASI
jgi:hypothetical protein